MVVKPLVSIIMNCHNGEKYLSQAIDSIYKQDYLNWEIIFFDNCSNDASAAIARSYDDKVKYYYNETKVPLYTARNLALNYSTGTIVTFLDCDDLWLPDYLTLAMEIFKEGYQVVFGKFRNINEAGYLIKSKKIKSSSQFGVNQLLKNNFISISALMVTADVLKKNRFDARYNLLGDFDLWLRLAEQYSFGEIGKVVELSRQHPTNLSKSLQTSWLKERRYLYRKFFSFSYIKKYPALIRYIMKSECKGLLKIY